ncbi:MAG: Holliday junction resolvase RuvX [bacterium]|nr:Holliday junction resolvase RuvX [bacterium]
MMKILGIDYGRSKVGLAFSESSLAEPFRVIHVESFDDAVKKVIEVIKVEQVEKVIVGVSEGKMGEESKKFSLSLSQSLKVPVEIHDETLTSQDAQTRALEAGIGQKKRREMEDAYAASIMLQNYIDLR